MSKDIWERKEIREGEVEQIFANSTGRDSVGRRPWWEGENILKYVSWGECLETSSLRIHSQRLPMLTYCNFGPLSPSKQVPLKKNIDYINQRPRGRPPPPPPTLSSYKQSNVTRLLEKYFIKELLWIKSKKT